MFYSNWINKILLGVCGDFLEDQNQGERKNIKLKESKIKSIFSSIGFDINVNHAMVGLLHFSIPWNKIWKEPSRIVIKEVLISVSTKGQFSKEFQQKRQQSIKTALLEAISNQFLQSISNNNQAIKQGGYWKSVKNFFSEMIVIDIEDFHLKIEDEAICIRNTKFSLGLTFKKLTLRPSDQKKNSTDRVLTFSIEQLASYLIVDSDNWVPDKQYSIDHASLNSKQNYLIEPFSSRIQIARRQDKQLNRDLSHTFIQFQDRITLNIDNVQFSALLKLLQLRKWYCQEGDHLTYRPDFNVRPKQNPASWISYFAKIVQSLIDQRRRRIKEQANSDVKMMKRREYLNIFLIEIWYDLTCQSNQKGHQQKQFQIELNGQVTSIEYMKLLELKKQYEQELLLEELVFQRKKAIRILQNESQLEEMLAKYKIDNQEVQTVNRFALFSPFQYFRRKDHSQQQGGRQELARILESIKTQNEMQSQDSQGPIIQVKKIQIALNCLYINYRVIIDRQSTIFLTNELSDIKFEINTSAQALDIALQVKNIQAIDCVNPNKEYQTIFGYHSRSNRSLIKQFQNQDKQLLAINYGMDKITKQKQLQINVLPILMSLNDTVLIRLQPFLVKLSRYDQFFELVKHTVKSECKRTVYGSLEQLCNRQNYVVDLTMEGLTLIVPESACKQNSPNLQMSLQQLKLETKNNINISIQSCFVNFYHTQHSQKSELPIVQPFTFNCTTLGEYEYKIANIKVKSQVSEIVVNVPLMNIDFIQNFIYNMMGTLDNIKKFHQQQNDDILQLQQSSSVRKRSQSLSLLRSQHSSVSRIDEVSSQNSDIFYDADEFLDFQCLVAKSVTPLEKRDLVIHKWKKFQKNLSYILEILYKQADPYMKLLLNSIQLSFIMEIPKFAINIITEKQKSRQSYYTMDNTTLQLIKYANSEVFEISCNTTQIVTSIFKLEALQKLHLYARHYQKDVLNGINSSMFRLIPLILKMKKLQLNYKMNIGKFELLFQDPNSSQNNYLKLIMVDFQNESITPLTLQYNSIENSEPFFLKIDQTSICKWTTQCQIKCNVKIEYMNSSLLKRNINPYEPFLEKTQLSVEFNKELQEQSFKIDCKSFQLNITPSLIQTLSDLNEHSIQLKQQLLLKPIGEPEELPMFRKLSDTRYFQMVSKDGLKLNINQLEQHHTVFGKSKYNIDLEHCQNDQDTDITDQFCQSSHIIVNLTTDKLLCKLNGIQSFLKSQDFQAIRCLDQFQLQFTPRDNSYGQSCAVQSSEQGVYFLKLTNTKDKSSQLYFLIKIIKLIPSLTILQIEQLPQSPYLIKNKCSQLICIAQSGKLQNKHIIESGESGGFCWDDPFNNKLLYLEIILKDKSLKFQVDIDAFFNQEVCIDKEYTLELFSDGVQKIIVLTEKAAVLARNKLWQISIAEIGISISHKEEIIYLSCRNVNYKQKELLEYTTYVFEFVNAQIDSQSQFLPCRCLYTYDEKDKMQTLQQSVRQLWFHNRNQQVVDDRQFRIACKQKIISEILIHLVYLKFTIPNIKFTLDGQMLLKLYEFGIEVKSLLNQGKVRNGQAGDRILTDETEIQNKTVHPKQVHIDRIQICRFQFKVKFKNLQLIEAPFKLLWNAAGLILFLLNQIKQMRFEFARFKHTDAQQIMDSNYELHIQQVTQFYSKIISQTMHQYISASQILKNQGNLIKQCQSELSKVVSKLNDSDSSYQFDLTFKFQILQTSLKIGQSVIAAAHQSCGTVLTGVQKLFETLNHNEQPVQPQQQRSTRLSNKLSKIFQKVTDFPKSMLPKKHSIQYYAQALIKDKIVRYPRYIEQNGALSEYSEQYGKIQIFRMWKLSERQLIEKDYVYELNPGIWLFITQSIFALIDTGNNQLLHELQTKQVHSIGNYEDSCWIKYNQVFDEDDIGMKQFKIMKIILNNNVEEQMMNRIMKLVKQYQNTINQSQTQIFTLMME